MNNTFIDTNITLGPQLCTLATGSLMGMASLAIFILSLLKYALFFYIVYRVTKIFLTKYQDPFKKH
jgi:hypothetical protein